MVIANHYWTENITPLHRCKFPCSQAGIMQISSMLMCLNFGNRWLMIEEVGDGWQSHYSYSKCRLGSHGTDRLVSLVKQTRNQAYTKGTSLFGAKITGGGCGGTVCVLGRTGATSQNQILQVMMALKHFKVCLREWGHETLSSLESRMLYVSCQLWFFSSSIVRIKLGFHAFTGQLLIQDLIQFTQLCI